MKQKVEKKKKKNKVLDFVKLEYYKEVLDFPDIKYHITFLITQIPGHLGSRVHWTWVLFRTRFWKTRVLKTSASLPQILSKCGIWLFSPPNQYMTNPESKSSNQIVFLKKSSNQI